MFTDLSPKIELNITSWSTNSHPDHYTNTNISLLTIQLVNYQHTETDYWILTIYANTCYIYR